MWKFHSLKKTNHLLSGEQAVGHDLSGTDSNDVTLKTFHK